MRDYGKVGVGKSQDVLSPSYWSYAVRFALFELGA